MLTFRGRVKALAKRQVQLALTWFVCYCKVLISYLMKQLLRLERFGP